MVFAGRKWQRDLVRAAVSTTPSTTYVDGCIVKICRVEKDDSGFFVRGSVAHFLLFSYLKSVISIVRFSPFACYRGCCCSAEDGDRVPWFDPLAEFCHGNIQLLLIPFFLSTWVAS